MSEQDTKIQNALDLHQKALNAFPVESIKQISNVISEALKNGNKVLICGNGGSASDSLHFAGEIVGRFKKERRALPAISLSADAAVLTCIGNDYGYDKVFERQVYAHGKKDDVLVAISTSGNSPNVLNAAKAAKESGLKVIGFTGEKDGKLHPFCDLSFRSPSAVTATIQEMHITAIHMICELVENSVC